MGCFKTGLKYTLIPFGVTRGIDHFVTPSLRHSVTSSLRHSVTHHKSLFLTVQPIGGLPA